MAVKRLRLSKEPEYTYDMIRKRWSESGPHTDVFSGHFLISFVSASSALEGIPVSYNTTREIFESERISGYTGDLRDVFSVMNNKRVAKILTTSLKMGEPLTIDLIKRVHDAALFASVDSHRYEDNGERAGEFKKHDYCTGKYSVGALPEEVPGLVEELCETVHSYSNADPLKLASVFHCYFENIHPFADGNGRVGRWLANYLLVKGGHPPILFTTESRAEYFQALERFDLTEELEPFASYLREQTIQSWPALRYQC